MEQSLRTLFFEHDATGGTVHRLRVGSHDVPAVALSLNQIGRRLRRDIEVVETLAALARRADALSPELARDAAQTVDDLSRVVRVLEHLQQPLLGSETGGS